MKKTVFFITIIWVFSCNIFSQSVSLEEAMRAGSHYLTADVSQIQCLHVAGSEAAPLFYVLGTENAYAVISGNKNCIPLLAFSHNTIFDKNHVIPPVVMWMNSYETQLNRMNKDHVLNPAAQALWFSLLHGEKGRKSNEEVSPFLTSKWGQGKEYNFYCPKDLDGTNGRAVTGCVATAMAQIIYYFRFPESGTGSYSYQHEEYGTISADFSDAIYDYDAMADNPANINLAASLLSFHLGVSVDMVYGANASGMYNHKAAYSMRTHFKYSPETQYIFRDSVDINWDSLMVSHLTRKIPLYYAGWSVPHTDGHAFVCDGYKLMDDTNYYYHFNFGWNGAFDGYFYTNDLTPGGSNFKLAQELIINAYPDTNVYSYPNQALNGSKTLNAEAGSFTDGSSPFSSYAANMDYTWHIMPDIDNLEKISFSLQYHIGTGDTLFVSSNDPNLADTMFTADSSIINLTIQGTEASVRFKTSNNLTEYLSGFTVHYYSVYERFCYSQEYFTGENGMIEDGSGSSNYNNYSRCVKSIRLGNVQYIELHFEQFETEENEDILYIYDAITTPPTLLETLSGYFEDSTLSFNTRRLDLVFETSEKNTFPGWKCSYRSGTTGIESPYESSECIIFPNPAYDCIYVKSLKTSDSPVTIHIFDIFGRLLLTDNFNTIEVQKINIDHLQPGSYILHIENERKETEKRKFIKL